MTLQWYKENPKERRDQLSPWLKSRAEALVELQVLIWRSSPEGHLATLSTRLEGLRDFVKGLEKKGDPAAPCYRQRYEGCARFTELMKQFLAAQDPEAKARLKAEMDALEAAEVQALEAVRREVVPAGGGASLPEPKPPRPSPLTGRWGIVSVAQRDERLISDQARSFIEFEVNGAGRFKLGHARGELDGKVGLRDGKEGIDFSWEGTDNTADRSGRGWAVLDGAELHGTIYFHKGGESNFGAKRTTRRQSST